MTSLFRLASSAVDLVGWPFRVAAQRQILSALARFDDRELADIGLSRQDLRDATALPLGADPSPHLRTRARGRGAL